MLGVLYFVLFCGLLFAWARTNKPDQPLNLWRFWLVQLAGIGAMASVAAPPLVYLTVGAILTFFMCAHFIVSKALETEFSHRVYVIATLVGGTLWYVLTAFYLQPHTRIITALVILVPSILGTYTKRGRRVSAWMIETWNGTYRR